MKTIYDELYSEGDELVRKLIKWLKKLREKGLVSGDEVRDIVNNDLKRIRKLYMKCMWEHIRIIGESIWG